MAEEQQQDDVMQPAFRPEGQFINAYIEQRGETPVLVHLGSLSVAIANPLVTSTWQKLMVMAVDLYAQSLSGQPMEVLDRRTAPAGGSA